jgi:hypothetical protein
LLERGVVKDGNLPEIDVAGIDVLEGEAGEALILLDCILESTDSLGTPDLDREDACVIFGEYPAI